MPSKTNKSKRIDAWLRRNKGQWVCDCGCGGDIEVKREHYRAGVPRFIKGHNFEAFNPQSGHTPPPEETYWDRLSDGEKRRRLNQLKSFPSGEDHPNWAGGTFVTESGYRMVLTPDYPFDTDGYVQEHRLVVEAWMRDNAPDHPFMMVVAGISYLNRECVVHHRDENKLNNRLSNLVLLRSQSTHLSWHMRQVPETDKFTEFAAHVFCPWVHIEAK